MLLYVGYNEFDYCDNVVIALKCVVVVDYYDWEDDVLLCMLWGSIIIYEVYVKGLMYLYLEILVEICGIYKVFGYLVMINYLK